MVVRRRSNKAVPPNPSMTQLSLSMSIMVLSKSKITTIPAMNMIFRLTNGRFIIFMLEVMFKTERNKVYIGQEKVWTKRFQRILREKCE